MPCGEKIHKVNEKWKREEERRGEAEKAIPLPANWPKKVTTETEKADADKGRVAK